MAPRQSGQTIVKQSHKRAFIQVGGARPNNKLTYAGADAQNVMIDDISDPIRGGVDQTRIHDPFRKGTYLTTGTTIDPPDFPDSSVTFQQKLGALSLPNVDANCPWTFYEPSGKCRSPANISTGWEDGVAIYSNGLGTDRTRTGNTSFGDDDDPSQTEIDFTFIGGVYDVGSLNFGELAGVEVDREVVDIVYGSQAQCGDCGPANDGTSWIYALLQDNTSSGTIGPQIVYSVDGGASWTVQNITTIGGAATVKACALMGPYLVVLSDSENAYHYATINELTGVPTTWTKVTTGFVATKTPNDIYAIAANEAYIVGNGGYIYGLSDVAGGVTVLNAGVATTVNLLRIDGAGETIIAVGATGAVIKSANRGRTWAATTTTPASTNTVQAVAVLDPYRYWIGTATTGSLYYTLNGGETWFQKNFPGFTGAGTIYDIVFATDEVGYVSWSDATPTAVLLSTFTGGMIWDSSKDSGQQRLKALPVFNRANRIATPPVGALGRIANTVALAGLSGGGTDGVIYQGVAAVR